MPRQPTPLSPDDRRRLQDAALLLRACAKAPRCRKVAPELASRIKGFVTNWLVNVDERPSEVDVDRAMGDIASVLAAYAQSKADNQIRTDSISAMLRAVEDKIADAEVMLGADNVGRVTRLLLDEVAFGIEVDYLAEQNAEADEKRGRWRLFKGMPASQRQHLGKAAKRAVARRRVLLSANRAATGPSFAVQTPSVAAALAQDAELARESVESQALKKVAIQVDSELLNGRIFGPLHQAIAKVRETISLPPEAGGLGIGISPPGGAVLAWAAFELYAAWMPQHTANHQSPHPLSKPPSTSTDGYLVGMACDLQAIAEGKPLRSELDETDADSVAGSDWVKRAVKGWNLGMPTTAFSDSRPRPTKRPANPPGTAIKKAPRGRTWCPEDDLVSEE